MAYNWLGSKCQRVKQFNTLMEKHKEIVKGKKGFQIVEDSYHSVAKFLGKGRPKLEEDKVSSSIEGKDGSGKDRTSEKYKKLKDKLSSSSGGDFKEDKLSSMKDV